MSDARDDSDAFVEGLRMRFNAGVESLDADTKARLAQLRRRALESDRRRPARLTLWVTAGALASACLAVVIYFLAVPAPSPQRHAPAQATVPAEDEMDLITNLKFYENLDFYQWLEQHELPS
ncbi:MAG: hypothetical protein P8126_03920 [Gammaproteobacteria bacterium]|jgi:type VI protein secretion system component VasF